MRRYEAFLAKGSSVGVNPVRHPGGFLALISCLAALRGMRRDGTVEAESSVKAWCEALR